MPLPPPAWSDPATDELLGLAVDLLLAGDPRGGTLLHSLLERECGREFAHSVRAALAGGTPPSAFDFLPPPSGLPAPVAAATEPRRPRARPAPLEPREPKALPGEGYVSVAAVAAHFGVSVKAVYRWMAAGRIEAERRPGGSYRIPAAQFRSAEDPRRWDAPGP